jgi:hypothetical protein
MPIARSGCRPISYLAGLFTPAQCRKTKWARSIGADCLNCKRRGVIVAWRFCATRGPARGYLKKSPVAPLQQLYGGVTDIVEPRNALARVFFGGNPMKTQHLLASASTAVMAGAAGAADLAVRGQPPILVPTWAGFYAGINGGVITHYNTIQDSE